MLMIMMWMALMGVLMRGSHALMGRALEANEIGVSFFFILHPSFLWQTNHAGTILQTEWPEDE